ncbi:DoxX family membrane protein [Nocardia sp. R6R-6]|uniref:DoxX family membrane protein n=1 Tax=Nocardia sp. R6R-6 TaxID=3459303 RepID=UPI00403D925F
MDIGLFILRAVLAAILFMHATQKIADWLSGPGLAGASAMFESLGQQPARPMAQLAATCEL